jgi:hypothetical protein
LLFLFSQRSDNVRININPVAQLQHVFFIPYSGQNQHQPSRAIATAISQQLSANSQQVYRFSQSLAVQRPTSRRRD